MAKQVRKPTGDTPKKVAALTGDELEKVRASIARTAALDETGPPLNDPCGIPACPESGTATLKCVDGVRQWVV